jgi:hypothetical protein
MRDYSERRQSRIAAPPKRPSVWPYALLILLFILIAYGAGLGTGWYLYRPGGRLYKAPKILQPATSPKTQSAVPQQGQPITPSPAQVQPAADKATGAPPLTFYNTLQKGNKVLMGTGINEPKESPQHAPSKPSSPSPPER